jgi:hypothetical protein
MGWEGDGRLESLRKKKVVLIDGVHLTPGNMFAAVFGVSDCRKRRYWRRARSTATLQIWV